MLYKYFPPHLTHVTALPCETQMFCNITLFATKCLNMVYLAELLVVMTDLLKIVRIRARNVSRKQTQAPR